MCVCVYIMYLSCIYNVYIYRCICIYVCVYIYYVPIVYISCTYIYIYIMYIRYIFRERESELQFFGLAQS